MILDSGARVSEGTFELAPQSTTLFAMRGAAYEVVRDCVCARGGTSQAPRGAVQSHPTCPRVGERAVVLAIARRPERPRRAAGPQALLAVAACRVDSSSGLALRDGPVAAELGSPGEYLQSPPSIADAHVAFLEPDERDREEANRSRDERGYTPPLNSTD